MHHTASAPYCIYGGRRKNGTINGTETARAAATKNCCPGAENSFYGILINVPDNSVRSSPPPSSPPAASPPRIKRTEGAPPTFRFRGASNTLHVGAPKCTVFVSRSKRNLGRSRRFSRQRGSTWNVYFNLERRTLSILDATFLPGPWIQDPDQNSNLSFTLFHCGAKLRVDIYQGYAQRVVQALFPNLDYSTRMYVS